MKTKLNLACGRDIRKGYINLDIAKLDGVDIVYDINKIPLPFGNEQFKEILAYAILEHVPEQSKLLLIFL